MYLCWCPCEANKAFMPESQWQEFSGALFQKFLVSFSVKCHIEAKRLHPHVHSNKTLPGNRVCRWRSLPLHPTWLTLHETKGRICLLGAASFVWLLPERQLLLSEISGRMTDLSLSIMCYMWEDLVTNWLTCEMSTIQGEFTYVRKQVIYRWELFRAPPFLGIEFII